MYVLIPEFRTTAPNHTTDPESHGRFRITRQLKNENQTLIKQQALGVDGWSIAHTNSVYEVVHHTSNNMV